MRGILAVCLVLVVASPSWAQDAGDTTRARELFQVGLDQARGQHWEAARDAFAESLTLAERPSTLLNLAGAQVQTGQLVEGAASYRRFLELATSGRDAAHRHEAETALQAVEARIAHTTIAVDGLAEGDEVRLDASVLTRGALGTILPLNPGAHDVSVMRDGRSIAAQHFQLAEGLSTDIGLTVAPVVAPTEVARTEGPTEPMDQAIAMPVEEPPPHGDDSGVWIAVGVSVGVAIAIGVVVAVLVATQDQGASPPYMGNLGPGIVRF